MLPPVPAPETAHDGHSPTPSEVRLQLERLVTSRQLKESHQLQAFLEFVVEETLEGRADGLKEYLLGCRVFRRRVDYDPRRDGIVRVQANALRKRMEKYYAEDGGHDPVIIEIPRGGYVATFRQRESAQPEPALEEAPPLPPAAPAREPSRTAQLRPFVLGLVCAALIFVAWRLSLPIAPKPFMVTQAQATDFPQLWSTFFKPGTNSLVTYGVPLFFASGGLYMRDVQVNSVGSGDQSRVKKFGETFQINLQPMDDLYTGVGELEATYRLSNFFATRGIPVRVANARTLGSSDLAGHNVVIVSSLRFQTLLTDLHLPAAFEFRPTQPEVIHMFHPAPGEQNDYVFQNGAGISTSYALASLWKGTSPGQRILHIGGVHTWATQAAVEYLLQPESLRRIAREFSRDAANGPHGRVSPSFQILMRVEGRGNQSHRVEYVTHQYLPESR